MGLPCLNCEQEVEPSEAQTFAGVFTCKACFEIATRLEQRALKDLQALTVQLRESIRLALIEKRLQLGPQLPLEDVSKADLLRAVVHLQEVKEKKDRAT